MTRFSSPEYRQMFADNCEEYSDGIETSDGEIVFEEHQQRALLNSAEAVRNGNRRFSIVQSTGSGKSVLIGAFAKASQEAKNGLSAEERNRRKDLIITVERSIISDIKSQIELVLGREVGIWGGGERRNLRPGIVVASIQALQHHSDNLGEFFNPNQVSLVIGDEADKFLTENRFEVIQQFQRALKIGLTATPQWPDKRHISTIFGDTIDTLSLQQGMERGVNVPALFYMFENEVNGDNIPVVGGDFDSKALEKALKSVEIENAICNIYDMLPRRERRNYPTLVYVPTLQLLEEVTLRMQREFGNLRISSWNGNTPKRKVEEEKREFREGRLDILILCGMGGRSLDLPRARLLIDASPTLSKNKLEQRHGRALRIIRPDSPEADSGFEKRFSVIYQILPHSNRFRPVTLLDVLDIDPEEYEPGELTRPGANGGGHGGGDDPEVRRLVRHFKSRPIRSNMRMLHASDLRGIITREDLPTIGEDGFLRIPV